jgi:hypothetical protein
MPRPARLGIIGFMSKQKKPSSNEKPGLGEGPLGPLKCPRCMGKARIDGKVCDACHGSGKFDPSSLTRDKE